jgi:predicted transcriptional regulator
MAFIDRNGLFCAPVQRALGFFTSMIAQKTRYALRSLLFLAEEQGGAPVQLSRIAETQRVPPKYLELIMLDLKKAGLVKSARGPKGSSCSTSRRQAS